VHERPRGAGEDVSVHQSSPTTGGQ
jgi:hypothetical protein